MKKLINGQDALIALANGSDVQCLRDGQWQSALTCTAVGFLKNAFEFRIAPKLIKIGGVEIEAPETEPLTAGENYYTPSLTGKDLFVPVTWLDQVRDFNNLKRGIVNLSPENAIAQAKALIMASGGILDEPAALTIATIDPEDPLAGLDLSLDMDVDADEPPPVEEHEDRPTPEKKTRTRKTNIKQVADTAPAEPANDTAEFVAPPAVEFDEPQPTDLDSDAAQEQTTSAAELSRVDKLLDQIVKSKTGDELNTIIMRYTTGLSEADYQIVNDAAIKRRGELVPHLLVEPEPPSLAERIKASQTIPDLAALVPEIMGLDIQIISNMETIYNQRRAELLKAKDGE